MAKQSRKLEEIIWAAEHSLGPEDQPPSNADKVAIVRLMADRCELGAEDRERLEDWCHAQIETPVVTVSLTESERVRLAARVSETFDSDAGLLRGIDAIDVSLLSKLGIDVRRPSTAESEQSMVEVLAKDRFTLGTRLQGDKERLQREGAENRAKLRSEVDCTHN